MAFDAFPSSCQATGRAHSDCTLCPVQGCMARGGSPEQTAAWVEILSPRMAVMPGAGVLFGVGDRLRAVYSVRGGCIKAFTVDADGNERIRGFYLPGDLIGLDALGDGYCRATAAAVVPSQVCVAPLADLKRLSIRQPELAQRLIEQTSRELATALALSGDFSADERVAAFLLNMRERLGAEPAARLPMAQRDIGNYLRLATETVCRTLKGFERKGWLSLEDKHIRFLDVRALQHLAEPVGLCAAPAQFRHAA
jgi:CRP/FNR family transcriptional regulator